MSVTFVDYYPTLEDKLKNNEMAVCSFKKLKKAIFYLESILPKEILDSVPELLKYNKEEVVFNDKEEKELINDKFVAFFEMNDFNSFKKLIKNNISESEYEILINNYMFSIIPM